MRWFVGDVHGCARELDALLRQIRFDPARDELWAVGDLVNRGPDSAEALRLWRDVGGRGVVGNHDLYALRAHAGDIPREADDTLAPLFAAPDAAELLARLAGLPGLLLLPAPPSGGICLVHAGLHPAWSDLDALARRLSGSSLEAVRRGDPALRFATLARCCSPDGEHSPWTGAPEDCPPPARPWDEFYRGERFVVHGHWAKRGVYRTARTLGLDSSCAWGGPLTAWCAEEDRLVQVRARPRRP
jgi:bis(5'-nucleosyl)-tetraphosphatase (symmetrical)